MSMLASSPPSTGEFELTDAVFRRIRELVKQRSGIALNEGKRSLVYGRLVRRVRALKLDGFASYLQLVEDAGNAESERFLNSITTNVTEFFRERYHFEYLAETILPELERARNRRIRIWSAGCSTGEEPYSTAMMLLDAGCQAPAWDVKILATDLDSDVLAHARTGVYSEERIGRLPASFRDKYFLRGAGAQKGRVRVRADVQKLVSFKRLNLMEQWPVHGPLQAIFCRNVIIYFDAPTCQKLIQRFVNLLDDDGRLFLGHSESLTGNASVGLTVCGKTTYRRTKKS